MTRGYVPSSSLVHLVHLLATVNQREFGYANKDAIYQNIQPVITSHSISKCPWFRSEP